MFVVDSVFRADCRWSWAGLCYVTAVLASVYAKHPSPAHGVATDFGGSALFRNCLEGKERYVSE